MLHCSTCRQNLTAYLENTLDPQTRAQVVAHLAECAECSRELRREAAIREALHGIGTQPAPVDLRARVRAAVEAEQARKPAPWAGWLTSINGLGRNLTWAGGTTALACALLLLVRANPELVERPAPQMAQAPEAAQPAPKLQTEESVAGPAKQVKPAAGVPASAAKPTAASRKPAPRTAAKQPAPVAEHRFAARSAERTSEAPSTFAPQRRAEAKPARRRHVETPGTKPEVAAISIPKSAPPAPPAGRSKMTGSRKPASKPSMVRESTPAPTADTVAGNSLFMAKSPPAESNITHNGMAATDVQDRAAAGGTDATALTETPLAAAVAPPPVFTVVASWEGAPTTDGRVSIMARSGFAAPTPQNPESLAPVTNVAPLRANDNGNAAMMARGDGNGNKRITASASAGAMQMKSAPAPVVQPNVVVAPTRRLRLVVTPQQDVKDARVRVQLPANGAAPASESVIWEGNAVQNQPITVTWVPPAVPGNLPPLSVILEQVDADERSHPLQTQIVVVPPQNSATTR